VAGAPGQLPIQYPKPTHMISDRGLCGALARRSPSQSAHNHRGYVDNSCHATERFRSHTQHVALPQPHLIGLAGRSQPGACAESVLVHDSQDRNDPPGKAASPLSSPELPGPGAVPL
jgi:hypothetical protein